MAWLQRPIMPPVGFHRRHISQKLPLGYHNSARVECYLIALMSLMKNFAVTSNRFVIFY